LAQYLIRTAQHPHLSIIQKLITMVLKSAWDFSIRNEIDEGNAKVAQ
jgi:hypothetical protein